MSAVPNHLCRGFLTSRIDQDVVAILDTHFALLNDGTVLQSDEHVRDTNFDCDSRNWTKVEALPFGAEFIGNYPVPAL